MSEQDPFITWDEKLDVNSKTNAMARFSDSVGAYNPVYRSVGYYSGRDYTNIEPNRSVRPGFDRNDYYAFRPGERIPQKQKQAIKMCMDAYDKVGIIRNVIDLMGDFGSQGIDFVHESKSVERFYKNWFKKIDGKERSERFLNHLYRSGNVITYRSFAEITPEITKYIRSIAKESPDVVVVPPDFAKSMVPWRYTFFNPLNVDLKDGNLNLFLGRKQYQLNTNIFSDNFKDGAIPANIMQTLPPEIKKAIKDNKRQIPLDPERLSVFYYKKDDWNMWANPMIYAILDDIVMLEKMRLADMAALDGAVSSVRLWTLGNLEHKILPTKAAITKLQQCLAGNVGGGTMDLVWGPELSMTESNSQIWKWLGSEKYNSVLNGIYAGLGVPPTLTGLAGNGGGFTNNFISLKTLLERLQYGRAQLVKFWEREIEIVRQAMGFRKPAHIMFDQMSLSDEATEKKLLIELADRDIISHQTLLERFKEIHDIEAIRLGRENKRRDDEKLPKKAGPYHEAQQKFSLEKIGLQSGALTPQDVGLETRVPDDILMPKPQPTGPSGPTPTKKPSNPNGRPLNKQDSGPRKKRVEKPRSKPGVAEFIVWSQDAFNKISDLTNKAYLGVKNKSNLRQLTKAEVQELESLKIDVLTSIESMSEIDETTIYNAISSNRRASKTFIQDMQDRGIAINKMTMDEYKKHVVGLYIEYMT